MTIGLSGRAALALVTVLVLSGCGSDARFKQVTVGISKDSVAVLSGGATPHHVESYLTGGKLWEVQFYAKPDATEADSSAWSMTPIVYADSKVVGTGWGYWKGQAKSLSIPLPPKP